MAGGTVFVAIVSVLIVFAMFVMVEVRSLNDPWRVTELRCAKPVIRLFSAPPVAPSFLGWVKQYAIED